MYHKHVAACKAAGTDTRKAAPGILTSVRFTGTNVYYVDHWAKSLLRPGGSSGATPAPGRRPPAGGVGPVRSAEQVAAGEMEEGE